MLTADSGDYHLITNAVSKVKDINGLTCEIGLRGGGGSYYVMEALSSTNQNKTHIAIDPYGNIEYESHENRKVRLDYTNAMRDQCMIDIYTAAKFLNVNFLFFPLEDTEFFKRYKDGVPVYQEFKTLMNKYSFVHFDGPHAIKPLIKEFNFFHSRMDKGATIVFDDVSSYYDHDLLEQKYILPAGWELLDKTTKKASYAKVV